jgi:hypothetical protein
MTCQNANRGIQAYLKVWRPGDRLFNSASVGSCLLLQAQDVPVFVDTRFDFYPDSLFSGTQDTLNLEAGWQSFLRRWHVNTFLVSREWPLSELLLTSPAYHVLYKDKYVVVARQSSPLH